MGTKTFDTQCYDLAASFLDDEPWFKSRPDDERDRFVNDLASEIQQTIEDEIERYRDLQKR